MVVAARLMPVGLAMVLWVAVSGCGGRSGGVIRETSEFTFDDIAAAAAEETAESENAAQ